MDVRNAERVSFRLYRIRRPDDLLWVADRIGDDFIYHDHGLQQDAKAIERMQHKLSIDRDRTRRRRGG